MIKSLLKRVLMNNPTKANYKFVLKSLVPVLDCEVTRDVMESKRISSIVRPVVMSNLELKKVLLISPHTDDETFGVGGTLLQLAESGCEIHIVYVASKFETEEETDALRKEAGLVSKVLGSKTYFLDAKPGNIPLGEGLEEKIKNIFDDVKPEAVFTTFLLDDHDDHRRVNNLICKSLRGTSHHFEVWSYQIYSTVIPNVVIDITNEIEAKCRLMDIWKTVRGNRNWTHYIKSLNGFNCRYLPTKKSVYAETFFVIPWPDYFELSERYFSNDLKKIYSKENYQND